MKTRYIVLSVFAITIFFMLTEWPERLHPEYRRITAFSEVQREEFDKRLASTVPKQTRIYLRDLADFEWDKVCYIYEYSSPRRALAKANALNKDYKILRLFPDFNEGEEGFIFINHNRVAAVVKGRHYNISDLTSSCADRSEARLIAIPSGVYLNAEQRKVYRLKPILSNLNIFGACKDKKNCAYLFTGE